MDSQNCLLLCLSIAWTSIYIIVSARRGSKPSAGKLPPGPARFPLIGNLLMIGHKPHESMAKFAKTHGPIMSLKLGCVTTIVISSPAMAREVLQKQDLSFCNRSIPDAARPFSRDQYSLVFLPVSTQWRIIRRICSSNIFSTQKLDSYQYIRTQKVNELLHRVEQSRQVGAAVNIGQEAFTTVLNLLSNIIFSIDVVDPHSQTAKEFKQLMRSLMEDGGKTNLVDYFPLLRKFDPQGVRRRCANLSERMIEHLDRVIKQRLELREVHGSRATRDVLDTLLNISEDNNNEFDTTMMLHLIMDLFIAGADTTSSTLEWAMAELLHNPEKLAKARAELLQTIGKDKLMEESDITRLQYLQAIVKETLRLHPPAPFLVPRKVITETEIHGFTIPKDAQVLVNVWAMGRDPNVWENPIAFTPERFLGSDIDLRGKNFELIPFGSGRRICPGLPLATRMTHLMLGSLIHSFDWKLEDGVTPENMKMEEKFGFTLQKAQPLYAIPIHV